MDVTATIRTSAAKTMAIAQSPSVSASSVPRSPWHSPVPYLFGGLAAMLGLIAFALLILACSYWRLSGYLEGGSGNERDLEAGEGNENGTDDGELKKPVFEEKFLVIMPGQEKCLATPMSSRASSFGSTSSGNSSCSSNTSSDENKEEEEESKNLGGQGQQVEMGTMTNRDHHVS